MIPKAAENADGACQLIKTWTSPEVQKASPLRPDICRCVRALPPIRTSTSLRSPHIPTLLQYAGSNPLNFTWPENTDLLNEVLSEMIQKAITGQMRRRMPWPRP